MPFKSDRQRRAVMAKLKGNSGVSVHPVIIKSQKRKDKQAVSKKQLGLVVCGGVGEILFLRSLHEKKSRKR